MELGDELREHAEKAHDPFDRKVGASMAVIAAVLALVAVYGHISTTDELLLQQKASDQWAFYQAKALRRYQSDVARDILGAIPTGAAAAQKYAANEERFQKEGDAIQEKARELERDSEAAGRRALRLHLGEIFLEIAIVFASLAILTKRAAFWGTGIMGAVVGAAVAATALFAGR